MDYVIKCGDEYHREPGTFTTCQRNAQRFPDDNKPSIDHVRLLLGPDARYVKIVPRRSTEPTETLPTPF